MPSALSLFYDPQWIQKHYAKMPTKLYWMNVQNNDRGGMKQVWPTDCGAHM